MSLEAIRSAIESDVQARWQQTPVGFENTDFVPPQDDPWVFVWIDVAAAHPLGVGRGHGTRYLGTAQFDVNLPPTVRGTRTGRELMDAILSLYDEQRIDGVYLHRPVFSKLTVKGWTRHVVSFELRYDVLGGACQ